VGAVSIGETLARQFCERHPEAAAAALEGLPPADVAATLLAMDEDAAMALVRCMPRPTVTHAVPRLSPDRATAILERLPLRDALDIVARLATPARAACLAGLSPQRAVALGQGLERRSDTLAEVMEVDVFNLSEDATVAQALEALAQAHEDPGCHLLVSDTAGRLQGALAVRDLYRAHAGSHLGSLPLHPIARLPADARAAGIAQHDAWLRFTRLPVVDGGGRLVGMIHRERLQDRRPTVPRSGSGGVLDMLLALLEGYASAHVAVVDLFLHRGTRRG